MCVWVAMSGVFFIYILVYNYVFTDAGRWLMGDQGGQAEEGRRRWRGWAAVQRDATYITLHLV